jgi:hypothetical protein
VDGGGEGRYHGKIWRGLGRGVPLEELIDEAGVKVGGAELGVFQDLAEEGEVGADAADIVFVEGAEEAGSGVIAGIGPDG